MSYSDDRWIEIEKLFVEDGWTQAQISEHFSGRPTKQAISIRASRPEKSGPDKGLTWHDKRTRRRREKYERLTPQARADMLMKKLDEILSSDMPLNQFTDALKKMSSTLVEMRDPLFILPVKLEAIKELIVFMRNNQPKFNTQQFHKLVANFKDHLVDEAYKALR